VLFVDLHGYDDAPATADQALQSLLRALGVEPEHIPVAADDRAALYRSMLAGQARERGPVLVLADDASSPDQVRPLVPGSARHRVLVTSRDRLPQLGARLLPLDQLTPRAAYEVLDLALRIADPDDSRVRDDPMAAERLAGLCGHLPLALQIAGALLAEDRDMPVRELVGEIAESRDRLSYLDDGERSMRAAFDLSYRRLPAEQARLLRLLALAPGPEVSDEVAAVLVGTEAPPVMGLKALARAHLVERGSGRGWWRLHDLVRAFGAAEVAREEADVAKGRVLAYYNRWADAADDRLRWLPGSPEPARFADRRQALAWLDGERPGLVAAVLWGREERFADTAVRLAQCLGTYFGWRRYFEDWITVSQAAQEAAQCVGNRTGEAIAWNNLGLALRKAGRVEEAIDAHTRDRDLCQAAGDSHGEATAWNNLGLALLDAGRVEEAIKAHIRARDVFSAAGDRHSAAAAWNNMGIALAKAGRVEEAIKAYYMDLAICREFEDWYGAGETLQNLAVAYVAKRRPAEGRAHLLQAAEAFARAGAATEAAGSRARAAALTEAPAPTDTPTPASPPAHTTDSAPPSPHPPDAPDSAGP
jgi:tetratricopeptide (TPR) repeat protein